LKGARRFRKIWIWVFFIGVALLLFSSNSGRRPIWNPAEQLIVEITAPFQQLIKKTVDTTESLWTGYFHLVGVQRENRRLRTRIGELRISNRRYKEALSTHGRLRQLLRFKQSIDRQVLAAQVIGLDPTGWFKSIIIDKGKKDGLKVSMPVVNASGVVGRVVSVSPNFAKVLLIIDQNSAVDCLIQRSRDRGIVKGSGIDRCKLDYAAKSSDVVAGDAVITSGLGGVFPKGLWVGQVLKVKEVKGGLFKDIEVKPFVDFSRLEEVLVVLKEGAKSELKKEEG
jgi:rod shape-determining protein MreC